MSCAPVPNKKKDDEHSSTAPPVTKKQKDKPAKRKRPALWLIAVEFKSTTISLHVFDTDTVYTLKDQLSEESKIPVDNQCVTVKSTGVVLEDEEEKIGVYNVLEDSILVLTIQGTIYTGPPKAPIEDYKAHPRISFTGGTLLSQKGKYLIADWIEEEYIEHPRLKFVLTYKGTKHGFSCSRFHEICDSEGCPCVVMVQSTNGNIFGGYTTHSWRLNNHYREGLFMFTVFDKNKNRIKEPTKFRLKKKKAVYVRCKETAGPIFGDLRDLYIANDCNKYAISFCQLGRSYGFPEGFQKANNLKDTTKVFLAARRRFKVAEIEVYMI